VCQLRVHHFQKVLDLTTINDPGHFLAAQSVFNVEENPNFRLKSSPGGILRLSLVIEDKCLSRFVLSLILCMTVASKQPSLALANDADNLVVKNAQPKKVDGRSTSHQNAPAQKVIQQANKSPQSQQKGPAQGVNKSTVQTDLGFPYKASVPVMKTKTGSIPDERTMREEIDAFVKGKSNVLRGYDAR
jgi:hypothetical protein